MKIAKPRTFKQFPEDSKCPICGTNAAGECILLGIDGTQSGGNEQAKPTHLWCAVATRWNNQAGVAYKMADVRTEG